MQIFTKKSTKYFVLLCTVLFSFLMTDVFAQTPPHFKTGTGTANSFPFGSTTSNKVQWLYFPSNFPTATTRGKITKVYFRTSSAATTPFVFTNLTVKMGYTTLTTFATGPFETGLQTCLSAASYTIQPTGAGNWIEISLTSPFIYDPTKNFLVEVSQTAYTTGFSVYQMADPGNRRLYGGVASSTGTAGAGGLADFGFTLDPLSTNDAGVVRVDSPITFCSGSTKDIYATIRNMGMNQLTSVNVNWSVDGVLRPSIPYTTLLDTVGGAGSNTALINLGSVTFPTSASKAIKVWTSSPNGVLDTVPKNDTVKKSLKPSFNGIVTVGSALGRDYPTLAAAAADISTYGVCGPVIINVDTGTYTGKVSFNNVLGSSAINTITVNGHGAKIRHLSDANDPTGYVLQIRGVNYVTIDSLDIELLSGSTKGFVVSLGEANYCVIKNSKIRGDQSGTSTTYGGLIVSGSNTSYSTATTAKYNKFFNNDISGGYLGVSMYGATATPGNLKGNEVYNNTVRDYYIYGIYHIGGDSTQIVGNDIHRLNRLSVSTGYGINLAAGASPRLLVKNNKIHNLFEQNKTSTNTFYGLYTGADGTSGNEVDLVNNAVFNIESNGTMYPIYETGGDYNRFYHNTIFIDNPSSTAGVCYGVYYLSAAVGTEYKNNIISINKGGSGNKFGFYWSVSTNPVVSNYNDIYVAPSSGTGTQKIGRWGTTDYVLLADWQTANTSAFDQNSVSVDPTIGGAAQFNAKPNAPLINDICLAIPSVGTDILGISRGSSPDPGAYEFTPANDDAGITSIISPVGICPGASDVKVKVKNFGSANLTSVTLNWTLNNVTQTPFVYTGLILPGTDSILTIGSFTAAANTPYSFRIWTSNPNSGADANHANDTVVLNNLKTGLLGTVTVGGVGANFPSLTALATELNANGVCGPLVVNVNASTSPYLEQVVINKIKGSSSTNTITLNGNGSTIQFTSTSSINRAGIRLNGASYVTIDSFVINSLGRGSSQYGGGVELNSGSNYNTIKNCRILLDDSISSTQHMGIMLAGSAGSYTASGEYKYNTITNNFINGGYAGITIYGTSGSATAMGNTISKNRITNPYVYGIYNVYPDSTQIIGNDISRPINKFTSTFYGVYNSTVTRARIEGNKIHNAFGPNVTSTSTSYGVYLTASATVGNENYIVNNAIYDFRNNGANYGIYSSSANTRIYHNTVSIEYTGATTGSAYGIYQANATNVDVKNNAVSVTKTGSVARYGLYYSYTFAANSSTSDYNNVNVANGVSFGYVNAAARNTLADWKTATTTYDLNSLSSDLLLNGTRNLVPQLGSPLISAGTSISSVTKDLLGNPRNLAAPYIGAYEVSGDYVGPKNVFVPILNTISTTNKILTGFVTVTDPAGVDTSLANRPRIYYKKTTDNNFFTGNTSANNGWKYTVATNNSSPFNFVIDYSLLTGGSASVGDRIEYFVVSKDLLGNVGIANASLMDDPTSLLIPNNIFPASGTNSYRIAVGKSGTVYVGTNETYKTLTGNGGVFEDINNNLLSGNIDIVVKTNLTETGVHGLNAFAETGGSGYKISIRPISDTLRTISGSYAGGLIRINGADRVTIDGRYNGAGSFLKFINTTATSGNSTIQVISLGQNAGVERFTIRNSTIVGGTAGDAIPVHIGGLSLPYASGASNNNISIINNTIMRGSVGIFSGSESGFESDSLLIEGNTIGSSVLAEQIRLYGMAIEVNKNTFINNNTIKNIINTAAQQAWGIAVYSGFKNGKITNNKIEKVSSGSGAFGGRGIEIISGKQNENILVANNFVGGITGSGAGNLSSTSNVGISIRATGGVKVYFNSVSVSGNVSRATTTPDISAALHIGAGAKGLDIKNNSFSNSLINIQDTALAYSFYSEVGDTAYTAMDYNNFNVATSSQGILGRMVSADLQNLASIKLATGKNVSSISARPNYFGEVDLHAKGINLYQKGTPIAGFTTDIDNDTRSITTPCIGADEFTPLANDLLAVKILNPGTTGCGTNADSVSLIIDNIGLNTQTGFPVTVNMTGAYTGSVSKTYTKSLAAGGRDTVHVGYYNSNVTGNINYTAIVNSSVEMDRESDTVKSFAYYSPTPVAPTVIGDTICAGDTASLVASTTATALQWYTNASGGLPIYSGTNFKSGPISKDSLFYVEASNLGTSTGLTTTMVAGNGQSGAMFDLEAINSPLQITGFKWNQTGVVIGTIEIWTFNGTYLGNDGSSAGWTLVHSAAVSSIVGTNTINLPPSKYFVIQPGQKKGVYFTWVSGSIAYTNVPEPTVYSNTDLRIITGRGKTYPFGSGSSFAGRAWNGTVMYASPGCPSPRVPVMVKRALKPSGSTIAQATPFQGVFNAGTSIQPDAACLGDTLTYSLTPPTGFTLSGLGTTWTITNAVVKTVNGANPVGAISTTGNTLRYIAAAGDIDSVLKFTANIQSLLPNGCDSSITRYLKIYASPKDSLGSDKVSCVGSPVTLDAKNPGATYLWSTGATTKTISVSTAGSYWVKVTNAAGCDSRDTVNVTFTPVPVVTLGNDVSVCVGSGVTLDAGNAGASYLWSTGATTQTITVASTGAYSVMVTSGTCSSRDTINVTFNALPVVELGTNQLICTSDTITVDAGNPGSTYVWSTGATTRTIQVSLAGTYKVTVTNAKGCVATDSIVITNKVAPSALFTSQATNLLNVQFNGTTQPGNTFAWNFGDPTSPANTSALINPIHQFTAPGTYFVSLTVTNVSTGCVSVNVDTIEVVSIGVNSSAKNTQSLTAIPNPFVGNTKIEYVLLDNANSVSIEVFDVVGRKVANLLNGVPQTSGKHSIQYVNEDKSYSSGVYIVQLTVDGKTSIIRMVDIASK